MNNNEYIIEFSIEEKYQLLFLTFVEDALAKASLHSVPGMNMCYLRQEKDSWFVDIAGSNVHAVQGLSPKLVDLDAIYCNSTWLVYNSYGVEAARATIVREAARVFEAYSISVDERHLGLVADYMTQLGSIRGCNRVGIAEEPCTLEKASFERATYFLAQSA